MSFDFQQLANFRLARGSHKQPNKGGNICVNEAAVIAAGFQYREIRDVSCLPDCFSRPVSELVSSSGRAVERLPVLAQDAVRRGHEVSAHGWRWEGHVDLDEAEKRDRIARHGGSNYGGDRQPARRLAHPVSGFGPHSAPAGRGRRLPLRQRRLQ